ncbi:ABC transporter substrate-binding protein [Afifella pfennigii]|uniref:ABC transporter substrate-binding protein n=1 Tax=Afifella pfennigii TaxID=209897 RepID=UPI0009FECEC3|nr:ABC transporter substrate-binding protein [Afifella pfennigii]
MLMKKVAARIVLAAAAAGVAGAAWAEDGPIKVGFVGGLTGACAALVEDELNAVRMGVDELNAAGGILGRQVELVVRDSQTKPDEGAKQSRELIVGEDIDLLTGVCSSSVMLAMTAVSKELKVPFYSAIGSTQKANVEAYQPYFWQVQANATMEAVAAAEYVAKKPEWRRIVPMGFDYEWGHSSVDAFTTHLKKLRPEIEITDPIFPKVGEANMAPYITAALAKQPDAIFAAVFGGGLASLIKQGQGYGMFERSNLVTLLTVDALQSMGDAMPKERVFGVARAPFFAIEDSEDARAFIAHYRSKYGEYPTDWSINGYDGLMFYAAAAEAAGSVEPDALMKAVHEITFDGLRGNALKVRAFDGQMNAPSYVGEVSFEDGYDFAIMKNVEVYAGEALMWPEETIQAARDAAK